MSALRHAPRLGRAAAQDEAVVDRMKEPPHPERDPGLDPGKRSKDAQASRQPAGSGALAGTGGSGLGAGGRLVALAAAAVDREQQVALRSLGGGGLAAAGG